MQRGSKPFKDTLGTTLELKSGALPLPGAIDHSPVALLFALPSGQRDTDLTLALAAAPGLFPKARLSTHVHPGVARLAAGGARGGAAKCPGGEEGLRWSGPSGSSAADSKPEGFRPAPEDVAARRHRRLVARG